MGLHVVSVGDTVMITKGERAGVRGTVVKNLNAHAIKVKVTTDGPFKGKTLNNVRYGYYEKM